MNTTNDTPRTDAVEENWNGALSIKRLRDHARQLEREADAYAKVLHDSLAREDAFYKQLAAAQTLADNQAEDIERLLADKARLDWLEANGDELWCTENVAGNIEDYWIHSTRAAIDAARKEGP